ELGDRPSGRRRTGARRVLVRPDGVLGCRQRPPSRTAPARSSPSQWTRTGRGLGCTVADRLTWRAAPMPGPLVDSANLPSVIRFEKVTKTYPGGTHPSLDNVSIDIEKGEFVFLVGTSGSGKSTALRLVLRETRCTKGRVYVAGKEINRLAGWKVPRLRRQIGTVFQDFRLLPNKTVSENVAFALQVIVKSRSDIRATVPETLELVGLD